MAGEEVVVVPTPEHIVLPEGGIGLVVAAEGVDTVATVDGVLTRLTVGEVVA